MAAADAAGNGGKLVSLVETIAVLLLTLGTLGSAWSVFQATRWNGRQADQVNESNVTRIESSKAFNLATQKVGYDASLVAQYARAVVEGQTELQRFLREQLFRPEFLPVLEAWASERNARATDAPNLFQNQGYITDTFADATRLETEAERLSQQADRSGEIADDYVFNTVLLAVVLFFAGIAANYRSTLLRAVPLLLAILMLATAAARLADLPVA